MTYLSDDKALSYLSATMRVLPRSEKADLLNRLSTCTGNPFDKNLLASLFFKRIHCQVLTHPEFLSQETLADVRNRRSFQRLLRGICAYTDAEAATQEAFAKSVYKPANPVRKLLFALRFRRSSSFERE